MKKLTQRQLTIQALTDAIEFNKMQLNLIYSHSTEYHIDVYKRHMAEIQSYKELRNKLLAKEIKKDLIKDSKN